MLHLAVFTGNQAQSAAFTQVPILQTLFENVQANGLQVGDKLNMVVGLMSYGTTLDRVQLQSPSLRMGGILPDFTPVRRGAIGLNVLHNYWDMRAAPLKFPATESLQVWVVQLLAGAEQEYVGLLLADQVPAPVVKPYRTVRFNGSTTVTVNQLTQCIMTSEQALPAGNYDVIGARAQSASCLFFRVGTGYSGSRPGGVGVTTSTAADPMIQRAGNLGTWFSFKNTDQVVAEFLCGAADTSEIVEFDLVGPY
jgi:hypothetical protein